ncbi:ribonuclease h [Gigaspora margarita]|uniref:ribonuclease H n=1 Tax=Gigaspora margarita TaxID=4874 RepID=A0A8H4EK25_GIGMA|nr:ribonuclease h [Gigaspora margarita]
MPKSTIGYYAVRIGHKLGIYINWEEYGYCENNGKKNALASIGVFFEDNDPRNLSERLPGDHQTNNRAELYAAICALEKVNNEQDLIVFTDSTYVINCCNVRHPKKNFDLVNRLNDLLKERKGKSIFKHVREHSGVYENKQADRLAYLGSQKTDVKEFNFPKRKQSIKEFFKQ